MKRVKVFKYIRFFSVSFFSYCFMITHYCVRDFAICISLKLFLSVIFSNIYTCLYLSHVAHVLVMIEYFSDEITDCINKSPEKNKTLSFLKLFELSVMRIKLFKVFNAKALLGLHSV